MTIQKGGVMRKNLFLSAVALFLLLPGNVRGSGMEGIYLNGAHGTSTRIDGGVRFSLTSQGKEKKAFDAHAVFPLKTAIRQEKLYQVRFKARGNAKMVLQTAMKQRPRPYAFVGLPAESVRTYSISSSERMYEYQVRAAKSFDPGECAIYFYFGANPKGSQLELRDLECSEMTEPLPLDLSKQANFGFYDSVENDGKGGWTDQGPNNCFAKFPLGTQTFLGIPFHILDPKRNGGRSILSFHYGKVETRLREAGLVLPLEKRRYLYLLHTAAWASKKKTLAGSLIFEGDVATVSRPVFTGQEVGDWWSPMELPNGKVVCEQMLNGVRIGAYLSKFEIPVGTSRIRLQTTGACSWIVIAATIADQEMSGTSSIPLTITANREWRPIPLSPKILRKSALDLTEPRSPAGSFGRVIARPDGSLTFSDRPDLRLRLNGFNFTPHRLFSYPEYLNKLPEREWKRKLREYADQVAANGFNAIRWHFLDYTLMMGKKTDILPVPVKPEDISFDPLMTDMFFYLFHLLKERGIYSIVDLATSSAGWTSGYPYLSDPQKAPRIANRYFKNAMYYDPVLRANWKAGATRLLTMRNPYTGTSLKEDPALAVVVFFNEQFFDWTPQHCNALDGEWQRWMQKRSGTRKTFPKLQKSLAYTTEPLGVAMSLFLGEKEAELVDFYLRTVRECGYPGLVNTFDNYFTLNRIPAMEKLSVIASHPYDFHPVYSGKTTLIEQGSSITGSPRMAVQCPFLGKPFFVTEYNHVMWNKFRHEGTIRGATVAALQNYGALIMHANGVVLTQKPMQPFQAADDPIWRGNNLLTHFIFLRGDVSPNPHSIAFYVTDEDIRKEGLGEVNFRLSSLGWLARLGVLYEHSGNIGKTHPSLAVSPKNGALRTIGKAPRTPETELSTDALVRILRKKKLLPADNRSNPEQGIYHSATNEVLVDVKHQEMSVITPRLEMQVVKRKNRTFELDALTIRSASIPAGIAAVSLEKTAALPDSGHVLLVILTDALNSGMKFASQKRVELIDEGKLPVLLQCGKFSLELKSRQTAPVLYALNCSGKRVEEIPIQIRNGRLTFTVDTGTLKEPAIFFELVGKSWK